jgi:ADP-heptose:LPS heptosyltransferase
MRTKILIISTNAMGDTYLSAAAIAPLRTHFGAECEIHFLALTNTMNARLLVDALDVDVAWYLPSKSFKNILACYFSIFRVRYDYVFSFFPGRVNTFFLMLVRSKIRIGFPNVAKVVEWYRLRQKVYCSVKKDVDLIWQDGMTYLERIGLCLRTGDILYSSLSKPLLRVQEGMARPLSAFTLVHFTSTRKDRALNFKAQCSLLSFLFSQTDNQIVVLGWHGETAQLKQSFQSNMRVTFLEDAALPTLVHYIVSARLFIAVDSFPLHVADAYKTNFIGIFGPTHPGAFQSCSKSVAFSCDDLSIIDGNDIIGRIASLFST